MYFIARKDNKEIFKAEILLYPKRYKKFFSLFVFSLAVILSAKNVSAESFKLDDFAKTETDRLTDEVPVVENVEIRQRYKSISVSWKKGALQETEAVVLVRSEGRCPLFPKEGLEMYRGNGDSYQDNTVFAGMKYCYGIFVTDASGRYSRMVVSDLMEKDGAVSYVFSRLDGNMMIFVGLLLVFILAWMHKKTVYDLKKRKRRVVVL